MTILDAYAVIAFLRNEPAAAEVLPLIAAGSAAMTSVGLAEVTDHLIRLADVSEDDAALDIAQLGLDDAVVIGPAVGGAAGRLRARHYHRTRCPVSMADCCAAEVARALERPLATADPDLLTVCHRESIRIMPLPGSDGRVWKPVCEA